MWLEKSNNRVDGLHFTFLTLNLKWALHPAQRSYWDSVILLLVEVSGSYFLLEP